MNMFKNKNDVARKETIDGSRKCRRKCRVLDLLLRWRMFGTSFRSQSKRCRCTLLSMPASWNVSRFAEELHSFDTSSLYASRAFHLPSGFTTQLHCHHVGRGPTSRNHSGLVGYRYAWLISNYAVGVFYELLQLQGYQIASVVAFSYLVLTIWWGFSDFQGDAGEMPMRISKL